MSCRATLLASTERRNVDVSQKLMTTLASCEQSSERAGASFSAPFPGVLSPVCVFHIIGEKNHYGLFGFCSVDLDCVGTQTLLPFAEILHSSCAFALLRYFVLRCLIFHENMRVARTVQPVYFSIFRCPRNHYVPVAVVSQLVNRHRLSRPSVLCVFSR